jgi:hypothetical protein
LQNGFVDSVEEIATQRERNACVDSVRKGKIASNTTRHNSKIQTHSGLDNAGKTSVVKTFNGESIDTISPTLGFNIQTLAFEE